MGTDYTCTLVRGSAELPPQVFVLPVPAAVYITAAVCACVYHCGCVCMLVRVYITAAVCACVYHCGCICMLVRAYITAAVCACSSGDRRPGPTSAAMNGCVDAALGLRMTAAAPCACGCVQRHLQRVCTPPDDAEPVGAEHATGHPALARAQRRPRNPRAHRYGAPSRGGVCARVCVSLCVCVCVCVYQGVRVVKRVNVYTCSGTTHAEQSLWAYLSGATSTYAHVTVYTCTGKTRAEQSAELGRTVVALALSRGSAVARLGRPRLILPASARFIWMLYRGRWWQNPMRRRSVGAGGGGAERRSVAAGHERGGWAPRESR